MDEQKLRRKHGGDFWGAFGSSLGSICHGFGNHLGIIQSLRRHPEGPRPPRRLQEVLDSKSDADLGSTAKSQLKY
jgi:hypothetical protein